MQLIEIYEKRQEHRREYLYRLIETQCIDFLFHDAERQGFHTHCDSDLTGDIWIDCIRSAFGMRCCVYPVEIQPGYRQALTTPENCLYTQIYPIDYYSLEPSSIRDILFSVLNNYTRERKNEIGH